MEGTATTPEIPFGIQAELRHVRETRRALTGGLAGEMLREGALGLRASFTARGALDPSLGASVAFGADHEKALESIRSAVRGVGLPTASDHLLETPAFAEFTTGVGKALRDTVARTARTVGHGGLSGTVEETARIAMGPAGTESKALGIDPDFIRDAASVALGRPRRTRDFLGDDALGALGISGERWGKQLETLTRGLAPISSARSRKAVASLGGMLVGRPDLEETSRQAMAAIRGVAPGLGAADRFDFSGFLPGHRWGAEELSSLIGGTIADQAQFEELSRTALSFTGALTPDLSEMTRGILAGTPGPWARGGILGDRPFASAIEMNSVFGADAGKRLRAVDLAGFGAGLDPDVTRGLLRGLGGGLEPTMVRGLTPDLSAGLDLAHGVIDSPAWPGLRGLASDPKWSQLLADAEAALDLPATDPADEPVHEEEVAGRETLSVAERIREMGFWIPVPTRRDAAFWINFLVAIDTVSEAMAAGDPRKVFFAMMSLAALTITWRGGSRDGD